MGTSAGGAASLPCKTMLQCPCCACAWSRVYGGASDGAAELALDAECAAVRKNGSASSARGCTVSCTRTATQGARSDGDDDGSASLWRCCSLLCGERKVAQREPATQPSLT